MIILRTIFRIVNIIPVRNIKMALLLNLALKHKQLRDIKKRSDEIE